VFQGEPSAFRDGERRGSPSGHLPLQAFVSFLQTHDQVGNRAFGERLHQLADPTLLRAAWACLLLSPHVPMFFMGDEFAASAPFLYFCDFEQKLAAAVSAGRREEFGRFKAFDDTDAALPEPNDPATFAASKLDWAECALSPHREMLEYIGQLLTLRQRHLVPRLAQQAGGGSSRLEGSTLHVSWPLRDGHWHLLAHFGTDEVCGVAAPRGLTIHRDSVEVEPASTLRLTRGGVLVVAEHRDGDG
jgi:maltooligosyltrehalose trehalohydrolase